MSEITANPLMKHFRQPKLFIDLPSKGLFYPPGALEKTENNQYPVYPMTAKDEIMMKTPDALLNGQSTVSVIQNCVPNIKDAWKVPSIDLDALLIAIRIASYGEMLGMSVTIPVVNEEREFETNLVELLDYLNSQTYTPVFTHGEFTVETQPLTYRQFTDVALKTFEEQRILRIVDDDSMGELEKMEKFNDSFARLTDMNLTSVYNSVVSITIGDNTVTDKNHILDFLNNSPVDFYKALLDHVDSQRKNFSVPPRKLVTTPEDREAGAPEEMDVPIAFDQSNFFA